jgi:hypothetical protein
MAGSVASNGGNKVTALEYEAITRLPEITVKTRSRVLSSDDQPRAEWVRKRSLEAKSYQRYVPVLFSYGFVSARLVSQGPQGRDRFLARVVRGTMIASM